jgi:hypothetical protein
MIDRPNPGVRVNMTGRKAVFHTDNPYEYIASDRVVSVTDWR